MSGRKEDKMRREYRRLKRGRPTRAHNHGTIGGYMRHRRRGEDACPECRAAWRLYYKRYPYERKLREIEKAEEERRREQAGD